MLTRIKGGRVVDPANGVDGIRDIAISMLGTELGRSPAIVSFLERETEGNAFFLVEAVRELAKACGEAWMKTEAGGAI